MFLNSPTWNKFKPLSLVLMCEVVFSDLHVLSRFKQLSIVLMCSVGLSSFEQFRNTHSCTEVANLLASTSHHVTFLLYCYPVLAFLMGKSGGPRCPRCQAALADLRSDRLRQAWAEFPGVKWSWVGERAFWKLCLQCHKGQWGDDGRCHNRYCVPCGGVFRPVSQLSPAGQPRPALPNQPASPSLAQWASQPASPSLALPSPAQLADNHHHLLSIYYLFTILFTILLTIYFLSIYYLNSAF